MLYIPKQVQNPLLMYITVSPPYNIKLYLEMNDFQTTSKEHGLITVQSMSPAFQTWRIFKNRWFCHYCIQSFMLKYISHYSWLHLLFSFSTLLWCCPKSTNTVVLLSCVSFTQCSYHPSWWTGAFPSDVVTDASILAWAPLLALWPMLARGTEVLTAVEVKVVV